MANLLLDMLNLDILGIAIATTENKNEHPVNSCSATTAVQLCGRLSLVNKALRDRMRTDSYIWRLIIDNLPGHFHSTFCLIGHCMKKQAESLDTILDLRELVKNMCSADFCLHILQTDDDPQNNQIMNVDYDEIVGVFSLGPRERHNEEDSTGGHIYYAIARDSEDFGLYFSTTSPRLKRFYEGGFWHTIPQHEGLNEAEKIFVGVGDRISLASENLLTQRSFVLALKDRYTGFVWSSEDICSESDGGDPPQSFRITAPKAGANED